MRISEIPHVEHGRIAVCSCQGIFGIDEATVVEEYSLPDLPPPESIGRYRIVRYVGRGASNCVYEGIDPETGVTAAIKTLHPDYAGDKPSREQFLHAAKIYAKAVHPDIVKVYEIGKDANGVPFLALEFLPGGTLADRMTENGRFPAKETAKIGAAVCRALTVTAELGIVHRDIKPDNIMIAADGRYKLTDLGLAKLDTTNSTENGLCVLEEDRNGATMRKTSFGTLEYMSPEQFIDADSCDVRSDIYSLGVTMYHLVAGRLPFEPRTRSELRHMHLSVEPLVPSTHAPDIPIDFDYIVMHCIQKRPEDRYQTPDELLADLEAFLADRPLPSTTSGAVPFVHTPSPAPVRPRKTGRDMLLPVVAIILVFLIFCAAGLLILAKRSTARQADRTQETPATQDIAPDRIGTGGIPGPVSADRSGRTLPGTEGVAEAPAVEQKQDSEIAAQYEAAVQAAKRALAAGSGFRDAINGLDVFTSFEEYSGNAFELISELRKASDDKVAALMKELEKKAAPLIEAGDFDGAVEAYRNDIGPLATESQMLREQKIYEIEQMRQLRPSGASEADIEEPPKP